MRGFGALVLAFVVSGVVAGAVQVALGITFNAREKLIVTMMVLAAMTLITTFILGLALAGSTTVSGVDWTAGVLLGVTMLIIFGLAAIVVAMSPRSPIVREDVAIFLEIVVPFAVTMSVQWWLVRRHWIKSAAAAAVDTGAASR